MVTSGANGSSLTLTASGGFAYISVNGGTPVQYTWDERGMVGYNLQAGNA